MAAWMSAQSPSDISVIRQLFKHLRQLIHSQYFGLCQAFNPRADTTSSMGVPAQWHPPPADGAPVASGAGRA